MKSSSIFWSSYLAKCPPVNLCLRRALSQKLKERLASKKSSCNHTLLHQKNQKFQLLMAEILWVIWPAAMIEPQMVWMVGISNKTWCKYKYWVPMETSMEGFCCLKIIEICKPRFSSTSCLNVCRSDPHFALRYSRGENFVSYLISTQYWSLAN